MHFDRRITPIVLLMLITSGCASLPPGSEAPKTASSALNDPEKTALGKRFEAAARQHNGNSAFRIIPVGADGFLIRMQIINAATRTLDLQYFIFRGDETGRLLTEAIIKAADRGVRVRLLVDDGETVSGDDQITALEAHRSIEIRIYNPFAYRGHNKLLRAKEFALNASRLNYRMHNKLLIVDNSVALIGGRNIGDQYFQIDPESQFADDDVCAAGPVAQGLSHTFDEYWKNDLSIPIEAISKNEQSVVDLNAHRKTLHEESQQLKQNRTDYVNRVATGEPLNGIVSGRLPLIWAHSQIVYDSPDKMKVKNGDRVGKLMQRAVANQAIAVQSELLMITPYLIPGKEGMQLFKSLRKRDVRVKILTSSLESSTMLLAQAGYMHYRMPLLDIGVDLYEVRSLLGNTKGSGQTATISRYGNYSLHAKMFVFDRKSLFIGSMNFDQRSMHLNTEIGVIIDSSELAQQVASRFDAMAQPANSYKLEIRSQGTFGFRRVAWLTSENGKPVEYKTEPARSKWQRDKARVMSLLPLDDQL